MSKLCDTSKYTLREFLKALPDMGVRIALGFNMITDDDYIITIVYPTKSSLEFAIRKEFLDCEVLSKNFDIGKAPAEGEVVAKIVIDTTHVGRRPTDTQDDKDMLSTCPCRFGNQTIMTATNNLGAIHPVQCELLSTYLQSLGLQVCPNGSKKRPNK